MASYVGTITTPTSFPGYPIEEAGDDGLWKWTERYWVQKSKVGVTLPAHGATTNQSGATITDRSSNQLYCQGRRIEAGPAPGIAVVELLYARNQITYSRMSPEDNPRNVSLRSQEIPIDDERLLTTTGGPFSVGQIATAVSAGYTSLPVYSIEYTYTDVDAAFAWTQAAIIASLQATGAPTGMGSATASKWRLIGRTISEQEETTVIESHWEYMASGFVPIVV